MSDRVEIVPLANAQIAEAANVCARAFFDVNLMVLHMPDVEERLRLGPVLFEQGIRYANLVGKVFTTVGVPAGVVYGWSMPVAQPTVHELTDAGLAPLPQLIGEEAVHRFEALVNPIEELQWRLVPPPCSYLGLLAVDPSRQGTGVGSALVRAFLRNAQQDALPVCLWTTTESNVPFYERLGFGVVADGIVPGSGLEYWIFRQDP